jgi:hypothetical protein
MKKAYSPKAVRKRALEIQKETRSFVDSICDAANADIKRLRARTLRVKIGQGLWRIESPVKGVGQLVFRLCAFPSGLWEEKHISTWPEIIRVSFELSGWDDPVYGKHVYLLREEGQEWVQYLAGVWVARILADRSFLRTQPAVFDRPWDPMVRSPWSFPDGKDRYRDLVDVRTIACQKARETWWHAQEPTERLGRSKYSLVRPLPLPERDAVWGWE